MTDTTVVSEQEFKTVQRRLRTALAQLAVYQENRYGFQIAVDVIENPAAKERLVEMFDHVNVVRVYFPAQHERERDSLVHVLTLILEADRLWPDGLLGLTGESGYFFGVVPFPIHGVAPIGRLAPVEWSCHS